MNFDKRLNNLENAAGARLVGCSNCRNRDLPPMVVVYPGQLEPDFTCPVCGHRPDKPLIARIEYADLPGGYANE